LSASASTQNPKSWTAIDLKIIDSHTHVLTTTGEKTYTPEMLVEEMKEAGVDYALIFPYEAETITGVVPTEKIIEIASKHKNLVAIGTASPFTLTEKRLEDIKTWLQDGSIRGVKFYLGYEHFYPDDERLNGLYEVLGRAGRPAVFHTGFFWDPDGRGNLEFAKPGRIGAVAKKFPELKIIIAHMSNPWIDECAKVVKENRNVYADVSGYFTGFKPIESKEVKEFFFDVDKFSRIAGSAQKLIYGSDWPFYSLKEYVRVAESLPFSEEEKELFFWKNAANLFGIN